MRLMEIYPKGQGEGISNAYRGFNGQDFNLAASPNTRSCERSYETPFQWLSLYMLCMSPPLPSHPLVLTPLNV